MKIKFKGTILTDKTSSRYKCLKLIKNEYGSLLKFLEDIDLTIISKEEKK